MNKYYFILFFPIFSLLLSSNKIDINTALSSIDGKNAYLDGEIEVADRVEQMEYISDDTVAPS